MTLAIRYDVLRDTINGCIGYRVLQADDVLQEGDETACGSMLLSLTNSEEWSRLDREDWSEYLGRTVAWANDKSRPDMDASERLFRRRVRSEAA